MKNFDRFMKDAKKNIVFIRASKANWEKLTKEQKDIAKDEIKKSKAAYKIINEVQKEIEKTGANFIIFKSLDSFPDIGHDVDILVERGMKGLRKTLMKEFNGGKIKPSLAMRISKKSSVSIPNSPIYVELHEEKYSQVGEYAIPGYQLMERSRKVKLYDVILKTTSPEDQLLIEVVHRIYRHLTVRFADVYNAYNLMEKEKLDWTYILSTAKKYGILPGLVMFISMAEKYGCDINNFRKFPYTLTGGEFLSFHSSKISNDLKRLKFGSAARLAFIYPILLVLRYTMAKLFDKGNLIW